MWLIEDFVMLGIAFVVIQILYFKIDKWNDAEATFREHGFLDFAELDKAIEESEMRALFNYSINSVLWVFVQIMRFIFIYLLSGYVYKMIFMKGNYKLLRFTDRNPFNQEFQN